MTTLRDGLPDSGSTGTDNGATTLSNTLQAITFMAIAGLCSEASLARTEPLGVAFWLINALLFWFLGTRALIRSWREV